MDKYPLIMGCNVIALTKNGMNYGMTCAWAQMIAYDKMMMLIGSQSETGNVLENGDIVGVSGLSKGQDKISNYIGSKHSTKVDKFKNIPIITKGSAILIEGAKSHSICEVENIIHVERLDDDKMVVLRIKETTNDESKEFLLFE